MTEAATAVDGAATWPAWLAEAVGRHAQELLRHLTGMLRSAEDAEDVLQEVWLAAKRSPPRTGAEANLRAWLYRVATNRALDRMATDGRRRALLCGRSAELGPEPTAAPDDFLRRLDANARARVRHGLSRLPRKQREAVWMRWIDGRGYEAIAARLECSRDSARANVYNGMKRLRSELFDLWKENGE